MANTEHSPNPDGLQLGSGNAESAETSSAAGTWREVESAPRDGTPIRVRYDDGTVEDGVYWSTERCCILGPRAGAYPPGWVSREADNLPVGDSPDITHWMPALAERDPSAVAPELGGGAKHD